MRMFPGDVTSPEKLCWLWCSFNNTVTEQAGKHDILEIFRVSLGEKTGDNTRT